jgi:3',5'-cyclic AMP phosphodiesterase CpdA
MKRFVLTVSLTLVVVAAAYGGGKDFHFAIIGDRTGGHVPGVYGEIVGEVNRLEPDIVVTVGDQIEGYTEDVATLTEQWDEYWGIADAIEAPFYVSPGNHDIFNDVMLDVWKDRTGHEPCYSFDYEGVHFTVLDTGRWNSSEQWLEESGYREWMEKDLAKHKKDRLTIVIYHVPFWSDTLAEGEADPLHDIFLANGVDAVFNGHFHVYANAEYDGIPYTIVGSSGGGIDDRGEHPGAFYHYLWCTVRGGDLSWAVLKKDSALAPDVVTAQDLKTVDRIWAEYVRIPSLRVEDGADALTCAVSVENVTADPITTPVSWEVPANWTVEPATTEITVPPGETAEVEFAAKRTGDLYPLPEVALTYPYRGELTYTHRTNLPALRVQPVKATAEAPAIDGDLGDACWAAAEAATYFCAPDGTAVTVDPTTFYFAYDEENLYVAAKCEQEDMEALALSAAERDDMVPYDDCVGFFLLADPQGDLFYQIYVNADGTVYDVAYTFAEPFELDTEGPPAWNGDYVIATGRGDGYWTFEAAIPVATLGADGIVAGDEWRVNFRRKERAKDSSADWQYPIGFDPRSFGYMVFE